MIACRGPTGPPLDALRMGGGGTRSIKTITVVASSSRQLRRTPAASLGAVNRPNLGIRISQVPNCT
jgi:hypothetical protein